MSTRELFKCNKCAKLLDLSGSGIWYGIMKLHFLWGIVVDRNFVAVPLSLAPFSITGVIIYNVIVVRSPSRHRLRPFYWCVLAKMCQCYCHIPIKRDFTGVYWGSSYDQYIIPDIISHNWVHTLFQLKRFRHLKHTTWDELFFYKCLSAIIYYRL